MKLKSYILAIKIEKRITNSIKTALEHRKSRSEREGIEIGYGTYVY